MVENWADVVADRMVDTSPLHKGKFLLLGAADTGKTTLLGALAERLVRRRQVALVDADIGQSHIGPPTTVGWNLLDREGSPATPGWEKITLEGGRATGGIAFVGDVTPVGHLLQLTAALALCVEQAQQAAEVVVVDTPGLVTGGAACSLWWTVQRLLRPEQIIAIQRGNELGELLTGLQAGLSAIETIAAPATLRRKSPEARQEHRRRLFEDYFQDAIALTLNLKGLAVRSTERMAGDNLAGRIVCLTDAAGRDMALGVIEHWQPGRMEMTIRAPQLDIRGVQCLTIGNARFEPRVGGSR